jgi:DNA-binding response OmpR family regulator
VTVVADGVSALRHLTHAKCLPSVVILDNDLPDACGLTVLGAMRADERTLSTPVILMGSDPKVRDDAWLADAFVMKPFNTCDIGALVARVSHPRRQTPVEQLLMSRS